MPTALPELADLRACYRAFFLSLTRKVAKIRPTQIPELPLCLLHKRFIFFLFYSNINYGGFVSTLMVSISGIRGEIGSTLTPAVIVKYIAAFAKYLKGGKVVLGRDSRVSGPFVNDLVKGVLISSGCEVIEIGIVPTPTVQLEIEHHRAAGGIAITASHNPIQWNGLKFMGSDGRFLNPEQAEKVYRLADDGQTG